MVIAWGDRKQWVGDRAMLNPGLVDVFGWFVMIVIGVISVSMLVDSFDNSYWK